MSIADRLDTIRDAIEGAACAVGRDPSTVRLVAVSKTKTAAMIDEAYAAGQTLFGENYVQELLEKAGHVRSPVSWHFIGHLQSNKVKYLVGLVSLIHSVDRLSLAEEIDRQWGKRGMVCDILVQLNISREGTKSGALEEEAISLVRAISLLPHVRIRGLMTIPPFFDNPERARPIFRRLRDIAREIDRLSLPNVSMEELSMGMSGDFVAAIAEGATLVRIGTAIFGSR